MYFKSIEDYELKLNEKINSICPKCKNPNFIVLISKYNINMKESYQDVNSYYCFECKQLGNINDRINKKNEIIVKETKKLKKNGK